MTGAVSRNATMLERLQHTGWTTALRRPELGACWEWDGSRTVKGYGRCSIGHRRYRGAHRVAFAVWNGPLVPGLVVCHRCDNPCCIRPEHLFQGTQSENLRDMQAKGRQRYVRGERHGVAKLADADVVRIRALAANGSSYGELAQMFDVTASNIGRIVRGQSRVLAAA